MEDRKELLKYFGVYYKDYLNSIVRMTKLRLVCVVFSSPKFRDFVLRANVRLWKTNFETANSEFLRRNNIVMHNYCARLVLRQTRIHTPGTQTNLNDDNHNHNNRHLRMRRVLCVENENVQGTQFRFKQIFDCIFVCFIRDLRYVWIQTSTICWVLSISLGLIIDYRRLDKKNKTRKI